MSTSARRRLMRDFKVCDLKENTTNFHGRFSIRFLRVILIFLLHFLLRFPAGMLAISFFAIIVANIANSVCKPTPLPVSLHHL